MEPVRHPRHDRRARSRLFFARRGDWYVSPQLGAAFHWPADKHPRARVFDPQFARRRVLCRSWRCVDIVRASGVTGERSGNYVTDSSREVTTLWGLSEGGSSRPGLCCRVWVANSVSVREFLGFFGLIPRHFYSFSAYHRGHCPALSAWWPLFCCCRICLDATPSPDSESGSE